MMRVKCLICLVFCYLLGFCFGVLHVSVGLLGLVFCLWCRFVAFWCLLRISCLWVDCWFVGAGTWIRLLLGGLFVCWIWRFVIYVARFCLMVMVMVGFAGRLGGSIAVGLCLLVVWFPAASVFVVGYLHYLVATHAGLYLVFVCVCVLMFAVFLASVLM